MTQETDNTARFVVRSEYAAGRDWYFVVDTFDHKPIDVRTLRRDKPTAYRTAAGAARAAVRLNRVMASIALPGR